MSNRNLDNLNSACCRVRGTIMTVEGIQKGSFPELIGGHAMIDGKAVPLTEVAERLEPLLKALLGPMLSELRELQQSKAA